MKKLVIPGSLTDLNTYINAERGNKFAAAKLKKDNTELVYQYCLKNKLGAIVAPCSVSVVWYCKNAKKDKDNISFAKKFILDGLVLAKVLKGDGWSEIGDFTDSFEIDVSNPRIEVFLS